MALNIVDQLASYGYLYPVIISIEDRKKIPATHDEVCDWIRDRMEEKTFTWVGWKFFFKHERDALEFALVWH